MFHRCNCRLRKHAQNMQWTILLPILRQTTRECVYIVRRDHFRSRDRQTWRSPHPIRKLHAACKLYGASSIKLHLLSIEVLHCRNAESRAHFCSCDLDVERIIFIYEHDLHHLKMYPLTKQELSASSLSKVIVLQTERHTDRQMSRKHYRATLHVVRITVYSMNRADLGRTVWENKQRAKVEEYSSQRDEVVPWLWDEGQIDNDERCYEQIDADQRHPTDVHNSHCCAVNNKIRLRESG